MRLDTGRLRVVAQAPEGEAASRESISPGQYLAEQRQRRGMSIDQLASATKIPRTSLTLLEEDRYEELPGPVFVKGFLRCCARALGVEPESVIELLYEQERAALKARRRERPSSGAHPDVAAVASRAGRVHSPGLAARLMAVIPSTSALLWIAIILLIALVVLAAFNLAGGERLTGQST